MVMKASVVHGGVGIRVTVIGVKVSVAFYMGT